MVNFDKYSPLIGQVYVPPRLGWKSGHHDTIKVELVLVRVNNEEWRKLEEKIEL